MYLYMIRPFNSDNNISSSTHRTKNKILAVLLCPMPNDYCVYTFSVQYCAYLPAMCLPYQRCVYLPSLRLTFSVLCLSSNTAFNLLCAVFIFQHCVYLLRAVFTFQHCVYLPAQRLTFSVLCLSSSTAFNLLCAVFIFQHSV